ncbi:MAG: glycosylase [Elusimicrobia bacterium]|nr:glycosylase [Elusimicrobiota bacterium]
MFKWKKLGRLFNPHDITDRPWWMYEYAQAPASLCLDNFVRVYFNCRPKPNQNGQYISYTGYVDLNRNNLFEILCVAQEPCLKLGKPGIFDEFGTYPVSVIKAEEKYVAYYGGWTRCESVPFNVAIGMAVSENGGQSFTKLGEGPVLSYSPNEPFVISGPKIRKYHGIYYLWYIAGKKWKVFNGRPEPIYKIRAASSMDGLTWKKFDKDLIPDVIGEDEAQASPDVFYKNGIYHMFFCFRQASDYRRNRSRSYRIGYARSENLIDWKRDDSVAGIDISSHGWDSEMVAYPHLLELDGTIFMMYLGNMVGRYGFGIAVLESGLP